MRISTNLPCFKCSNILSRKAFAKSDKRNYFSITEMNPRNFDLHDDKSIRDNAVYLRDNAPPVMTKGNHQAKQIALGLNYNPRGIILRMPRFDIAKGSCYDPQHVLLVNGVWNSEVGQLLTQAPHETHSDSIKDSICPAVTFDSNPRPSTVSANVP